MQFRPGRTAPPVVNVITESFWTGPDRRYVPGSSLSVTAIKHTLVCFKEAQTISGLSDAAVNPSLYLSVGPSSGGCEQCIHY